MFGLRAGGYAAAIALSGTTIVPQAWDSPATASTLPNIVVATEVAGSDVSPQVPVRSVAFPVPVESEISGAAKAPLADEPAVLPPAVLPPSVLPPSVLPIVSVVPATPLVAASEVRASLAAMVAEYRSTAVPDRERECLAGAIYFESKGEPLPGQVAVGQVIANRAKSGRFPKSWCGVVFQRSQFSFVRGRALPPIPRASAHWKTAVAVAHIVANELHDAVAPKSLFFHARYVSPGWKRVSKVATVGNHVFYR